MLAKKIYCWEPTELGTPVLAEAQKLYERTIDADERIPWMWIERAVAERNLRRPTGWVKRLLLAFNSTNLDDPESLVGYTYGAYIPGFGGYICYVGVAETARGQGVGKQLFDAMSRAFEYDASLAGEPLPFVIWESYRPTSLDSAAEHDLWNARMKLFDRAGGLWLQGAELVAPDYSNEDPIASVPLQLFVKPVQEPRDSFTPTRLRAILAELLEKVYHEKPGEYFHDATFANWRGARLVSPRVSEFTRVA